MRHPSEGATRLQYQLSDRIDPVTSLVLMVQELADQVDVLTGLVQGQDAEGAWMGPELGHLLGRDGR